MIKFPQMNPVRFRVAAWGDSFPEKQTTIDQYTIGTQLFEGVYPVNYAPKFGRFTLTPFQFETDVPLVDLTCKMYKDGVEYSTLTLTDITPTGYTGDTVYSTSIYSAVDGCYYVTVSDSLNEEIATSDTFQIGDYDKSLVKITYQNSTNRYGMVFFDSSTELFKGLIHAQGQLIDVDLAQEISAYETDRGEFEKLRATPVVSYELKLYSINIAYSKVFNLIFSCDTITINDIEFENSEGISVERIEDTDLCNISVKVRQKDYDYTWDQ